MDMPNKFNKKLGGFEKHFVAVSEYLNFRLKWRIVKKNDHRVSFGTILTFFHPHLNIHNRSCKHLKKIFVNKNLI